MAIFQMLDGIFIDAWNHLPMHKRIKKYKAKLRTDFDLHLNIWFERKNEQKKEKCQ